MVAVDEDLWPVDNVVTVYNSHDRWEALVVVRSEYGKGSSSGLLGTAAQNTAQLVGGNSVLALWIAEAKVEQVDHSLHSWRCTLDVNAVGHVHKLLALTEM